MKKNTSNMSSKHKFLLKIIICMALLLIVFFTVQEKIGILAVFAKDEEINGNRETKDHINLSDSVIQDIEYYDNLIKTTYSNAELTNKEYELVLLQRDLINNAGSYDIKEFVNQSEENRDTFNWLFNNVDNLRMYTTGGKTEGSYIQSFKVLNELYQTYKEDLNDNTISELGNRYGDIYQKIMITLSLTHSKEVRFWISDRVLQESGTAIDNSDPDSQNISNAVIRYNVYKKMLLEGKLENKIFEQLEVEEMRYVMSTELSDNEIEWLRDYTDKNEKKTPFKYVKYNKVESYYVPELYSEENKKMWDEKYDFSRYGIDYKSYYPHLWMIFELGGVCWQISNSGQNISASYGIPSITVGQPGHLAFMNYSLDDDGNVKWELINDIYGWEKTNNIGYTRTNSYHEIRMMNGWGNGDYASNDNASYMLLSQSAINDFEKYEKAKELVLSANSYNGDLIKKEEAFRKALEIQNINLDAWLGLINVYKENDKKTEEDYYNLAKEITEALKYYPLPMYDMLKLIFAEVESSEYNESLIVLQTEILKEAAEATDTQVNQSKVVKVMANYLLENTVTHILCGDLDGDGEITINDLAKLRLYFIDNNSLEGDYVLAADVDRDGVVTVNDLAMVKLMLVGVE